MLEKITTFVSGLVESRDPDLAGHQQRLGTSALAFADFIGCSLEEKKVLSVGARIHDIGKLSISDHILNKPARLTAVEYSLIQQHTVIGYRLLAPLDLDPRISEIVHFHHENFDGSGYPKGLAGANIPFLARMTRIWDSYDALVMDRPYHQGVSSAEALNILQHDSHLYDLDLLNEFCTMISKNSAAAT